jgi:hypothetical protein
MLRASSCLHADHSDASTRLRGSPPNLPQSDRHPQALEALRGTGGRHIGLKLMRQFAARRCLSTHYGAYIVALRLRPSGLFSLCERSLHD